jgi:hypothetical protein
MLNKDFKFRDDLKHDTVPVELLTDPYKGVILRYTKIKFEESADQQSATIRFEYELLERAGFTEVTLRRDHHFQKVISNILNTLILEAQEVKDGKDDTGAGTEGEVPGM